MFLGRSQPLERLAGKPHSALDDVQIAKPFPPQILAAMVVVLQTPMQPQCLEASRQAHPSCPVSGYLPAFLCVQIFTYLMCAAVYRWVPPSLRNKVGTGDSMEMKRREENSVRVTNLSEDTREEDLRVGCLCFPSTLEEQVSPMRASW